MNTRVERLVEDYNAVREAPGRSRAEQARTQRRMAEQRRRQERLQARLVEQRERIEDRLAAQRRYLSRPTKEVRCAIIAERRRQEELRRRALLRRLAAERAARARAAARAETRSVGRGDDIGAARPTG